MESYGTFIDQHIGSKSWTHHSDFTEEEKATMNAYYKSLIDQYELGEFEEFKDIEALRIKVQSGYQELKLKLKPDVDLDYWTKDNLWKEYSSTEVGTKLGEILNSEEHNIPRIHWNDLSVEEFIEKYQLPNKPVIIEGCADNWPAMDKWNFKHLYKEYGDKYFEIGEDQDGNPLTITLKEYIQYVIFNKDDSPFYLFQRDFHKIEGLKDLQNDYTPPKYFSEDYQQLMDDKYKPDYRWYLVGPRRSGSYMHFDPFSMSAWNTSLYGHK